MKSDKNKKYILSTLFLFIFYFIFGCMLVLIPLVTIELQGNVEWGLNLTLIEITKYIFGDGNELRYFYSSNPLYNPINLWELNLNTDILKIIFSIYRLCIIFTPFWHLIPQKKYRTATAFTFLAINNAMIFSWISYIVILVLNENSVLTERYFSSAENLNYDLRFTNAIIFTIILSCIMIIDILINNKFIIKEIREKSELKLDYVIDKEIDFEDSSYDKIRIEINQAYGRYMFTSMYILVRKLLENLIYDCVSKFYDDSIIENYYNINRNKHQNFITLIASFESMMKDPSYLMKADKIEDKLIMVLKGFREKGNKNAHSLFNLPHQSFIEEKWDLLNLLLGNLTSVKKRLQN